MTKPLTLTENRTHTQTCTYTRIRTQVAIEKLRGLAHIRHTRRRHTQPAYAGAQVGRARIQSRARPLSHGDNLGLPSDCRAAEPPYPRTRETRALEAFAPTYGSSDTQPRRHRLLRASAAARAGGVCMPATSTAISDGSKRGQRARRARHLYEERELRRLQSIARERGIEGVAGEIGSLSAATVDLVIHALDEREILVDAFGGPDELTPQRLLILEEILALGIAGRALMRRFLRNSGEGQLASRVGALFANRRAALRALGLDRHQREVTLADHLAARADDQEGHTAQEAESQSDA